MMARRYRTWLFARALPGERDALLTAFRQRRVLEECRSTIPGFLHAELLSSADDPDGVCMTVLWASRDASEAWQQSRVRAAQLPALMKLLAGPPVGQGFEVDSELGVGKWA